MNQECLYGSLRRKRREEYQGMVRDKVEEAEWKYSGVNYHWQQMKKLMMETAKDVCGMSKGPCTHKETWRWNEELDEVVSKGKEDKVRKLEERNYERGMKGVQE